MTDRPKGIVDPWRKVEPLRQPVRPVQDRKERIDIEDIDRDADLAIPGRYVLRGQHSSFHIVSVRVIAPKDALDVLADCVAEVWRIKPIAEALVAAGIGVRCRNGAMNVPSEEVPASMLRGGSSAFWFVQKPLDQGMLVLARIMGMPEAAAACKKHGITVMM